MLLIKNSRKSPLQGLNAQRNVGSNYLNSQRGGFQGGNGGGLQAGNPHTQNRTANQNYGSFAGYNQASTRDSYQPHAQSRPEYGNNRAGSMYQNQGNTSIAQSSLPMTDNEIALQKEIEKKIHFERMNKNL
jgi:hypothetical protein